MPGEKRACTCDTGKSGSQTCLDDGSAFGLCQCGEGMGAGGAGGAGGGMAASGSGMPAQTASTSAMSSSAMSSTAMSSSSSGGGLGCASNDCNECLASECAKLACSAEFAACDTEPDCLPYETCLTACQSPTCITQCKTMYPNGPKFVSAKSTCTFCSPTACRDYCNTNNICK